MTVYLYMSMYYAVAQLELPVTIKYMLARIHSRRNSLQQHTKNINYMVTLDSAPRIVAALKGDP